MPDNVAPNAAPAAYPLLLFDDDDDDDEVDDDDVEEAPVFMVRLKNGDERDELNEDVEEVSASSATFAEEERREDLAAKTARFAALLNMRWYLSIDQE
jgi:hypothetical protein